MYHPKFTVPSPENAQNGNPAAPAEDIEGFRLHDDEAANADRSRLIIQGKKLNQGLRKSLLQTGYPKEKKDNFCNSRSR